METGKTSGPKPSHMPDLYCPRCRREGEVAERLCYECGESLRAQGYCPICERSVLAPPGDQCPKHDVELLDAAPESDLDPSSTRLTTVATYGVTSEALGPKLRLEAECIPTFLQGARMGENAIYQVATGGVKLQVPEEFAAEARVILSQSWAAPTEDDDPDDPWEGLGPDHPAERRRSWMKVAILLFLFGPALAVGIAALITLLAGKF